MLLPLLVIAAGLGLGALGWLYGRLAGRERDLAQGVGGLQDHIEAARKSLEQRLEASAEAATERMTVPVAVLLFGFLIFIAAPAVATITSTTAGGPHP